MKVVDSIKKKLPSKLVNWNRKFTCNWIFDSLVVLCDGKVVCGCADPFGERPLGDLNTQTLNEIWHSELVKEIRRGLNSGGSSFCKHCGLKQYLNKEDSIDQQPEYVEKLPKLFIEPTIICNLSCYKAVCGFNSNIGASRKVQKLSMENFRKAVDEVGDQISRLHFFNYGEPFVHPKAVDMVEYIKRQFPKVYIFTSTNGLAFNEDKIDRLVKAGIDEIAFSIDGCNQESYEKYRCGGDFQKALKLMELFIKKRDLYKSSVPFINWRYILFRWNDSAEEMKKAVEIAAKIGVDRFTWEITDHPQGAYSLKYLPGSKDWESIKYELWDRGSLSNALDSKKYIGNIQLPCSSFELTGKNPGKLRVQVDNCGGATWHNSSEEGNWIRLGGQLHDINRCMIDRDYARGSIGKMVKKGDTCFIDIDLPEINEEGSYFIKFDMVAEGVDWFENGGSEVVWMEINVSF